ncbi:MAG: 50S ribosomal protein L9 [Cyanobacteria bacterium]|jgi:large subunit ribosomal protein L9|nr:50S ribosomal protein L9 [Cyanobacteria bacterium GSL.Bin21]
MAKRVQVVLRKDVKKLGQADDLVEVAPGYARNYLIPQSLASVATPGILKQVQQRQEKERQRQLAILKEAQDRKTALETIGRFMIRKQVGEGEAIFGTVTPQDVVDVVKETTGQDIDRRGVVLPDDISRIGFYPAEVRLHPEVTANIEIQVASL